MRIYADASFLLSWLYSGDKQNRRARRWFTAYQNKDQIALAKARGFQAVSFI